MGVLLGEAANAGVVVPGPQVVGPGLAVPVLPAVAEGVGVGGGGVLLVAEGVVIVGPVHCPGGGGNLHHVSVGILVIVQQAAAAPTGDEVDAVDVAAHQGAAPGLGHNVVPVQQEAGVLLPHRLAVQMDKGQAAGAAAPAVCCEMDSVWDLLFSG